MLNTTKKIVNVGLEISSCKFQKDKKYWEEQFQEIPEIAEIPGSKIKQTDNMKREN